MEREELIVRSLLNCLLHERGIQSAEDSVSMILEDIEDVLGAEQVELARRSVCSIVDI